MKINLLFDNPGDVRSGYLNIDGAAAFGGTGGPAPKDSRIHGPVNDLSHTVDANEVDEIVAMDILDHFSMKVADKVLDHWLSRLKHGGTLTVGVVDLRQVARELLSNSADIADINELLYGKQEKPHQFKQCVFTTSILVAMFRGKGYKILRSLSTNNRAIVTVQRP